VRQAPVVERFAPSPVVERVAPAPLRAPVRPIVETPIVERFAPRPAPYVAPVWPGFNPWAILA